MMTVGEIGEAVTRLIEERYSSDAAFERGMGLPPKTVSNWRRGRSSSFMKMLPRLQEMLGQDFGELLASSASEITSLAAEEQSLLSAWRATAALGEEERRLLLNTLLTVMQLSVGGTVHDS